MKNREVTGFIQYQVANFESNECKKFRFKQKTRKINQLNDEHALHYSTGFNINEDEDFPVIVDDLRS